VGVDVQINFEKKLKIMTSIYVFIVLLICDNKVVKEKKNDYFWKKREEKDI